MTRQKQLTNLITLSSISAVALYVVQGALATGADLASFPQWFWIVDYALWGVRAWIEARVILYLFSTHTTYKREARVLALFEVALIGLITLTLGPALRAVGTRQSVQDSMQAWAYTLWCFGIASYTPLMLGGTGYAYRVQPADADAVDVEALRADIAQGKAELEQAGELVLAWEAEAKQARAASALLEALPQQTRAELYTLAQKSNGNAPSVRDVSEAVRVSMDAARRGRAMVERGGAENE